jgi:protein involved in polysaccharide export with SLBB domain
MKVHDKTSARMAASVLQLSRSCVACVALLLGPTFIAAQQQERPAARTLTSELSKQNLNLVAASASDIKSILLQDSGLLVELKRWAANEATNQGQVLSEADLTDDAIFDRLESDVAFRSQATHILQQYGYLLPTINPSSIMGKQQDLLIQEHTKYIEQQAEQQQVQNIQESLAAQACLSAPSQCSSVQSPQTAQPSTQQAPGRGALPIELPSEETPGQQLFIPTTPAINPGSLQLASLVQNTQDSSGELGTFGGSPSSSLLQSLLGAGGGLGGLVAGSGLDASTLQRLSGSQFGGFGSGLSLTEGGLGSLFGGEPADSVASDQQQVVLDTVSPAHPSGSPLLPHADPNRTSVQNPRATGITARMVRAKDPYTDIPSLYDMYLQASPHPSEPVRFDSEVFENGSRDPQLIPMDLPAGPDYVVGPGDGLSIDLWGGVSQRFTRTVDREGRVSLPEAGPLLVSGKTLAEIQQSLEHTLQSQFHDESADVSLSRLRTIRIYEVGDVKNPGAYDISSLSTPLNALFAAGGPTDSGSMRIVKHYRGDQLLEEVDLYDLLLHGVRSGMARLENGDTVLVPPLGPQVTVEGMVRRPAIYELKDEKSLSSVLELAGGLLPTATLGHIEVQRLVAHEKQTMLSVDIAETESGAEMTKKLDAFEIQAGDRIRIYPIAPYNEDTVYLEGHVLRPGRYSYKQNMTIADLVSSYKDLLPEPATQYAEIIRLNAPDFHPSVVSFNIADALQNPSSAPVLQPMDTVRFFSRFDFEDAPSVSVAGDVRSPGIFPTSGQIHVSDAVHLAGGLAPDADAEDAQVFRYLPNGESKIFSVNLTAALAGSSTQNIVLQTRDMLLIHKSPDALQPATVYVQGDVGKPGRYRLTTNMTVADLIRVGGGLKPSADTQTADLTRYAYTAGGQPQLTGEHETVGIAAALAGEPAADIAVHNGDVLTIRELPGWNDLGASITIKGEVQHPGTYGIRPGELLSSIIQRAGGFQSDSYPYGAVLQRAEVRELETKQQQQLILRVKDQRASIDLLPETDVKTTQAKQMALQEYQTTLTQLTSNPPLGRVSIRISDRVGRWQNTPVDMEVRAGDTLTIPKRPGYVMVSGQVFNPTAVSYRPSRNARWYLSQSGGPTALANKKAIFVVRADGSVIGGEKDSLWSGDALSATLQPGDVVVVPEKAIGGGPNWQNLFTSAQVATSVASSIFLILHY